MGRSFLFLFEASTKIFFLGGHKFFLLCSPTMTQKIFFETQNKKLSKIDGSFSHIFLFEGGGMKICSPTVIKNFFFLIKKRSIGFFHENVTQLFEGLEIVFDRLLVWL